MLVSRGLTVLPVCSKNRSSRHSLTNSMGSAYAGKLKASASHGGMREKRHSRRSNVRWGPGVPRYHSSDVGACMRTCVYHMCVVTRPPTVATAIPTPTQPLLAVARAVSTPPTPPSLALPWTATLPAHEVRWPATPASAAVRAVTAPRRQDHTAASATARGDHACQTLRAYWHAPCRA